MVVLRSLFAAAALLCTHASAAGVQGTAFGFASGTTGGGNASPAAPSDLAELKTWLSDDTPRVILIDKEFNFIGSEDKCTDCECCIPESNTCGKSGQNAINTGSTDWCGSYPKTTCTYDKAGIEGLTVGSDKSIVGVGSAGVIRGKGLSITNGAKNIIIQNVHITELNPQYIWGGDAISLDGTDKVWIDHVKVSLVGRQMFVSGYKSSGSVTISNSEFDGRTSWSASCDGHHYWTVLGYGKNDQVTFANNYIHHTSGRSPKVEFSNYWHAYNNYWYRNSGHAFDVGKDSNVLIEGNVFANVKTPSEKDSGHVFAATNGDESSCKSALGRSCVPNKFASSGDISSSDSAVMSDWPSGEGKMTVMDASKVASYVVAHAGIGKLDGSASAASTVGAVSSASSSTPVASSSSASASMVKRFNVPGAPFISVFSQGGPGFPPVGAPTPVAPSSSASHSMVKRFNMPGAPFIPVFSQGGGPGATPFGAPTPIVPSSSASPSMVKRFNMPGSPFSPIFSQAGPGASALPSQPSWTWKTVHSSAKPSGPTGTGSVGQMPWH